MPTVIVVAVLVVIVALAVRSLIKQKKSGGGCTADGGHGNGCHCATGGAPPDGGAAPFYNGPGSCTHGKAPGGSDGMSALGASG